MRNYQNIDLYLNELAQDVYAQPEDGGHSALAYKVIERWMSRLTGCNSALDLGCGTGFCQDFFKIWNVEYEGICLGEDYVVAKDKGHNVKKMDFSFLDYKDESFDLLFSRHSLEHSPMPLLTLKEWYRVSRQWLGLVLPHPNHYTVKGRNHYSVLYLDQITWLLDVAGWKVIWSETDVELPAQPTEYWIFCEKVRK